MKPHLKGTLITWLIWGAVMKLILKNCTWLLLKSLFIMKKKEMNFVKKTKFHSAL